MPSLPVAVASAHAPSSWNRPDALSARAATAVSGSLEGVRNTPRAAPDVPTFVLEMDPRDEVPTFVLEMDPLDEVPTFVLDMDPPDEVPSKRARLEHELLSQAAGTDIVAAAWDIAGQLTEAEGPATADEIAVAWRALTDEEKYVVKMEGFAQSHGGTRNELNRRVNFWGEWRVPVRGHEAEYEAEQAMPRNTTSKPLRVLVAEYQDAHAGPIVLAHLLAHLKAEGVKSVAGLNTILEALANGAAKHEGGARPID